MLVLGAVAYGQATALWACRSQVGQGELLCVVGPNSAGKSTLINAIAGLHRICAGQHACSTGRTSRAWRRTASAPAASRWCPRGGACSPR
jgi:ABC-type branched-subunit amino acid transport system ATPase component